MHPKYQVLQRQIDALKGGKPDQAWSVQTIQLMLAAGATPEDLREISEHIKRGKIV